MSDLKPLRRPSKTLTKGGAQFLRQLANTNEHVASRHLVMLLDEIDAMDDEIERLRAELATVLDREAATIARYDRVVSVFDNENDRLCAQVARLGDALAPFAAEAEYAKPDDPDDDEVYDSFFTVGQFRRARAAINETEQ